MNKEKILKLLEELKEEINSNKKLKLESKNFRVDSDGWKKKTIDNFEILESPTKDIWEFNKGELKGEQLFTWDSAMRETKKAGKRMPTDEEFTKLIKTKEDIKNSVLAEYRCPSGSFISQCSDTEFWSSSESGANAWKRGLYSTYSTVLRSMVDKAYGFSVRCLQD